MSDKLTTVVCTSCKWTHFAVSRAYAEEEVKRFNEYYYSLPVEKQRENYGGRASSVTSYEKCWCGNGEFVEGNTAPDGSTLSPVIWEGPIES